jgi:glyceraldehyde-3-phosphate dehydrogenase (ferredoxin)
LANRSVLYELKIDLNTQMWGVSCPIDQSLIGPVQYGWDRYKKQPDSMTFGGGLLAGSPLPGTRRMIVCGYSPQWEGFFSSALGGAMYVMHRLGVNFIWLSGQLKTESILFLNYSNGNYIINFEPIKPADYWLGFTDHNGVNQTGFYGLQSYLFEKYKDQYQGDNWRILTVGPASSNTVSGGIGSNHIKQGELTVIDDWAGRGGLGSRLLQYHKIAGIVFGGDWQDPAMKEAKELDTYFLEKFNKSAILADLALSEKYRYVPKFNTGGTFGVNMHEGEDRIFSFNYSSIYQTPEKRLQQHQNFISDHYLKQFNEEIIQKKSFTHCGEPCGVACKKYSQEYKKDYEPYEALGPNIGVFDQRAAEKVNKYIDTQGMDAIQAGGTAAWLMELFSQKLLNPEDFGLENLRMKFTFSYSLTDFDIVHDSMVNALAAIQILEMILHTDPGIPFRKGIRFAAKWLDQKYSIDTINRAVFLSHGENGCMVPNQYWVPGMFSPMPIMGKYFTYYGNDFLSTQDLGKKNVERFVYELYSENSGSCRFHRKWVEDIIDEIILSHFDLHFDYWKTNFTLAQEITRAELNKSVYWESTRVVDIINQFMVLWKERGLIDPNLDRILAAFTTNSHDAGLSYWNELIESISDNVEQLFDEPKH